MPILSYDGATGEARFVPAHFNDPVEFVEIIRWQVKGGSRVRTGTLLAEIYWSDGTVEKMPCPAGSGGTIAATNRRIDYARLHRSPAQIAYRLE